MAGIHTLGTYLSIEKKKKIFARKENKIPKKDLFGGA